MSRDYRDDRIFFQKLMSEKLDEVEADIRAVLKKHNASVIGPRIVISLNGYDSRYAARKLPIGDPDRE